MKKSMMYPLLIGVLAVAFGGSQAQAAFKVKVSIGTEDGKGVFSASSSQTYTDGVDLIDNTTTTDVKDGAISHLFIFGASTTNPNGDYRISITASSDSPGGPTSGMVTEATTAVRRLGGTDNVVRIEVIQDAIDGFDFASVGTPMGLTTNFASTGWAASTNSSATAFSTADGTSTTPLTITTTTQVENSTTFTLANDPFDVSNTLTLRNLSTSNGTSNTTADYTGTLTSTVTALPVPPAIALFASALPFSLFFLRRRKPQA